jgi:hypothetical protein
MAGNFMFARIALLGLLTSGGDAAANDITPAWSRHCVLPTSVVRDDTDRAQLQSLVERCTAHDACELACRASSCEETVDKPGADRFAERQCGLDHQDARTTARETVPEDDREWRRADVARAAGLDPLAQATLPDGVVEVRLWASTWRYVRQPMLRLRRSARGVVTGELYSVYDADYATSADAEGRAFRRWLRSDCRQAYLGERMGACRARFVHEPRWDALYRRFEALGLLTLPDQDDLPRPEAGTDCTAVPDEPCELEYIVVTDGSGMEVEVRQGSAYRTYAYDSNGAQGRDQAKVDAAFAILDEVLRMHWSFDAR